MLQRPASISDPAETAQRRRGMAFILVVLTILAIGCVVDALYR